MNSKRIKQYITYKPELLTADEIENIDMLLKKYNLSGCEVFMDDIVSRDLSLYNDEEEKQGLIKKLNELYIKRIHCSYWAYPTSFLTKINFNELIERFGGKKEVINYYGDLTGEHLYNRWVQEYELAMAVGAQAYVFHAIDYAPIDGAWEFTLSRTEILNAMVSIVQNLLIILENKGLLTEDSPVIELENAGWGLEYGVQTSKDFKKLFDQLYSPMDKLRIGWDINHLLHAIGYDEKNKTACFMLGDNEITQGMNDLQQAYGAEPKVFALKWIEYNVCDPLIIKMINSLHLSDCELKKTEYFRNGRLQNKYSTEIDALNSWAEKEDYGVKIVLSKYDSHVPLGQGVLTEEGIKFIIQKLEESNENLILLHELKNSSAFISDLEKQLYTLKYKQPLL